MSVAAADERNLPVLRHLDIVLIVVAAPILLLIGVSATGYLAGAAAWTVLRVLGLAAERLAEGSQDAGRAIGIRLGFMLARLFLLALTVILVRRSSGQDAGLAALLVVVGAFTLHMGISAAFRPRTR